ncbi:MAG: MerC domain-containing protein [Akkermansiaceae bacterium]|nr:MerC domain-containing protein [Akkermansiaceae bacterium]
MNTTTLTPPAIDLPKVDRIGVAASVLCAIHCGLAPVLLIAMPAFGRIWAHPASHALVAIFIVPLAAFSIRKGYRAHGKRWVMASAMIGILFVLVGAALPAFSKETPVNDPAPQVAAPVETEETEEGTCDAPTCEETTCDLCPSLAETEASDEPAACIDNCCPSVQVSETGEMSLHIPPAAIITTLGGVFLIVAHIGNLCGCAHACRQATCGECA